MSADHQLFEAMLYNNMNWIVHFHNHIDVALNRSKKDLDEDPEALEKDKRFWGHVYESTFPPQLRKSSFLLMIAHAEEMLYLMWEREPQGIELEQGHGLKKFKTFLAAHLGNLGEDPSYPILMKAQEIRNCLLHVAGRVSLSKQSEKLRRIIEASPDSYSIEHDRIEITREGVKAVQTAINDILVRVNNSQADGAA